MINTVRTNQILTWLENLPEWKLLSIAQNDKLAFRVFYSLQLGDLDHDSYIGETAMEELDKALRNEELEVQREQKDI